jgi:hypothetical protein
MFFELLTSFHAGLVLSFFQVQRRSHFHAEVIFKNHKTFEKKKTCFVDCLKELLLIINIMTFVVTQTTIHKTILRHELFLPISPSKQIGHPCVEAHLPLNYPS